MSPSTLVLCVILVIATCRSVVAQDPAPVPRVRSGNPAILALVEQGLTRSRTFRDLSEAIGRTDGIVYVEGGKCGRGAHACLVLVVTVAGPYRILRILIEPGRPSRRLIAAIGHELQHAVEVLNEPGIRSNAAMFQFFLRIGPTGGERFETPAAIRMELNVYAELGTQK